jgi:hypothetical protein
MRPIRITRGPLFVGGCTPGMFHSGSGGGPSGPPKPKSLPGRVWDWIKKILGKK